MAFLTRVDIYNRALDHCGQDPIDATLGFTEDSKKARLGGRVYDKLRQAELNRNVWRFATKRAILRAIDTNTMILAPALWSDTTTYFRGSIVIDDTGQMWISAIPNNLNYQPQNSTAWEQYFGPVTVSLYDSTVSYNSGELVYTAAGDGTNRVYLSLQNANTDNPATATAFDATVTYFKNQVVTYLSVAYMSLIDLNINNTPSASAAAWDSGTTYGAAAAVTGSDGIRYTSIAGGNLNNDPVTTTGFWTSTGTLTPWTSVFTGGSGSIKWLQVGGAEFPYGVTLQTPNIIYPLNAGPSSQATTRNVYRLPSSFLRKAPTDPKAGSTSTLGAPTNLPYDDWLWEGQYIVTQTVDPIILRFVADMVNVAEMTPLFCELLAARIGLEICESLTQSSDKLKTIGSEYEKFGTEARIINGIETGSEEPPLDDYLACRA